MSRSEPAAPAAEVPTAAPRPAFTLTPPPPQAEVKTLEPAVPAPDLAQPQQPNLPAARSFGSLSTAEKAAIAADPAVKAVTDLFGGQMVDATRKEPPPPEPTENKD